MAWIKMIEPGEATGELKAEYDQAVESLGALSVAKGVQAGASFAPAGARPSGVLGIAPSRLDLSRGDGVPTD